MKKAHFFKAKSRLGMINIPHKGTELNFGVEAGPDKVLSKNFLENFKDSTVDAFEFSKPEEINKVDYYKVLTDESKAFADFIKSNLQNDEIQVVIGGDHSVSFGAILNILHKYKHAKVGVIQIDSHSDLNLSSTSHTGNFHGMYLRPFFGDFDKSEINELSSNLKLPTSNLMYIGNLDLDSEEQRFIDENNIIDLSETLFDSNTIAAIILLKSFVKSFDHLHISFDIDVFDAEIVNATGTPSPKGFKKELVFDILNIIKKECSSFSFDLVEVNPARGNSKETVELAQEILKTMIQ